MPKPIKMPIYMDHNATTPVDPRVKAAMDPFLEAEFGNASSASHAYGWQAQTAVRKAREQVADLLGCRVNDIVFTSGATESNNMAILGVVRAFCKERPHVITQATEHKAVLEVCEVAHEFGADVTVLPVNAEGVISMDDLRKAVRPNTILISIMMANNETGAIQPIAEITKLAQEKKIILHTDAAQSAGKMNFELKTLPIDLLSISGHKIYGPKGVGALMYRGINREFHLKPLMYGGEQEKSLRPGTLNVAGIVGLGEACAICKKESAEEGQRLAGYQAQIINQVRERFPQVKLNGPRHMRLCNNISFSFPNLSPDDLVLYLSGVAYSSGSACNSGNPKPSHVLKAMGLEDQLARSTLRLGLGRFTKAEDVGFVTDKLLKMLEKTYA